MSPSGEPSPVVRLQGVTFAYFEEQPVLESCDLVLGAGLTLLLGPNGCGKSTLLKLMAGVEAPDAGRLWVHGCDLWRQEAVARQHLAYVPEQPDLTPYATVGEILTLVARLRLGRSLAASEVRAAVVVAMSKLGIDGLTGRTVRQLSKGQRRRVMLAAAQLGSPELLLLDEPLDALDRGSREAMLAWIGARCDSGGAAVVVSHELEPFLASARRVVTVVDGRAEVHEPLPDGTTARWELLEGWARHGHPMLG